MFLSPDISDLGSYIFFQHSYREVGILLLYLAVGVSVFSGVAYTAEEENEGFHTIPACWWWGTVSMTTVGYGDVVPETVGGKLAASGKGPGECQEGINAKTYDQLQVIFQGIEGKIRAGGPNLDMGYWESLLQQLRAHMARAR